MSYVSIIVCHSYHISKIVQLKSQISAKLASFSHIPPFPDPPNTGPPLNYLPPVTHAEVYKILTSVPPKSSSADLIPPSLIKSCPGVFSELISVLANLSFSEGCFPTLFKKAVVIPLLKKPCLDKSAPSSYRPISNLNFISKILERLFLTRIQPHVFSSPNFNQHQSAYRRNYSTETALLSTYKLCCCVVCVIYKKYSTRGNLTLKHSLHFFEGKIPLNPF